MQDIARAREEEGEEEERRTKELHCILGHFQSLLSVFSLSSKVSDD